MSDTELAYEDSSDNDGHMLHEEASILNCVTEAVKVDGHFENVLRPRNKDVKIGYGEVTSTSYNEDSTVDKNLVYMFYKGARGGDALTFRFGELLRFKDERWESTGIEFTAKTMSRDCINIDPLIEVAIGQNLKDFYRSQNGITNMDDIQTAINGTRDTGILMQIDALFDGGSLHIIMPRVSSTPILEHCRLGLSCNTARHYFAGILKGLLFLQNAGFSHHDLNLEKNFQVDHNNDVVIINNIREGSWGTNFDIPPTSGDVWNVWSLGPILFSMFVDGLPPWNSKYDRKYIDFISGDFDQFLESFWSDGSYIKGTYTKQKLTGLGFTLESWTGFWKGEGPHSCLKLIQEICCSDPEYRLSIEQIQKHEWMSSIDTETNTDCKL